MTGCHDVAAPRRDTGPASALTLANHRGEIQHDGRIDELETLADNSVERRTVLRGDYAPGITSCDEEADGASAAA